MAPRATGEVLPPDGRRRSFSLRFRAFGKRQVIKLGRPEDGWTTQMADRELAVILRDVDLGTWRPPRPEAAPVKEVDPSFHEFASDWYATKELEVEPNTATTTATTSLTTCCRSSRSTTSRRSQWPRSTATASTRCARLPRSRRPPRAESR
jgi:hypothetical protein